ncbi:MAG: ComEC/Rec2 family competence protein [Eubacteriales bacterium]|jgi:beta-lactamase superfamily II metal-dependent hydrolase
MKIPNRLLSLLLALLVVATMFVSCRVNDDKDDTTDKTPAETTTETTTETTSETTMPEPNDLPIVANKQSSCYVVRADNLTNESVSVTCAIDIYNAIKNATGTAPEKITTDWTKDGTHDPDRIEILVGLTNYDESQYVYSQIGYGDYLIKIIGNKLVVAAYSDLALKVATSKLIDFIKNNAEEGSLTITADTVISDTVDTKLAAIPVYEGGTFSTTYPCSNKGIMVYVTKTNADEYREYLEKLEDSGYVEYTTNEIVGNLFATYNNSNYTVNAGYYNYEKAARIIIEPLAKPVGLKSDNVYTAVTTSQITGFGLEYKSGGSYVGNGLSILIRLTDGRFVVIDGGFDRSDNAANLVNAMKQQSAGYLKPGQKPTVAAWIITHAHGDHMGVLKRYSSFSGIKVEKFLVNFIADSERTKAMNAYSSNWSSGEGGGYTNTFTAANYFGADVQWVHVGQVFYIADLTMEILYTIESFGPKICNALNTTSLVIKMTFGEGDNKTIFMMTGDATGNALEICARMYGDYLRSDIVQVSHHGYSTWGNDNGVIMAYMYMLPETLLWPQGSNAYPNYKTKKYNVVLFSPEYVSGGQNPNFKEVYVTGVQGDTVILPIPYSVGSGIVTRK